LAYLALTGVDKVKEFISKCRVKAEILEFKDTVESVNSASKASGFPEDKILKTMIVIADKKPYAIVLPGDKKLSFKNIAETVGAKKVRLAKPNEIVNILGVGPGEVSPLMEEITRLNIIFDKSVLSKNIILVGGGSLHHLVKIGAKELVKVLKPKIGIIAKH